MKFSILLFLSLMTLSNAEPIYKTFNVNGKSINRWVELESIEEFDALGRFIHQIDTSTGYEVWVSYNANGHVVKASDGFIAKWDKNDLLLYTKDAHTECRCTREIDTVQVFDTQTKEFIGLTSEKCADEHCDTIGFDESFWNYDKWGNEISYSRYFIDENSNRVLQWQSQNQYNSEGDTIYHKSSDVECWNEFYQKGLKKQTVCKNGDKIISRKEYNKTGSIQYDWDENSVYINRDTINISIYDGDTTDFRLYDSTKNLVYEKTSHSSTYMSHDSLMYYSINYERWYEYDSSGNITHASNHDGQEEWWKYNDDGHIILHQFAEKESRDIEDVNGPSIITFDLSPNNNNFEFDNFNNLINSSITNVEYENNFPKKIIANDTEYYFTYDEQGNLLSIEDDIGNTQTFLHSQRLPNKRYHIINDLQWEINGLRNSHNQEIYSKQILSYYRSSSEFSTLSVWNVYNKKNQPVFSAIFSEPTGSMYFDFTEYDKNGNMLSKKAECKSLIPQKEDCGSWKEYENGKLVFSMSFFSRLFSFTKYDKNGKILYEKKDCNSVAPQKDDCESWEEYENGKLFHSYSKEREFWKYWWLENKKNVAGKIFETHVDGNKGAMHFNKKGDIEYQKAPDGSEYFFETLYNNGKRKKRISYRAI